MPTRRIGRRSSLSATTATPWPPDDLAAYRARWGGQTNQERPGTRWDPEWEDVRHKRHWSRNLMADEVKLFHHDDVGYQAWI